MSNESIKKNIISGVFWKFLERMAAQMVSVVVAIILARLLEPSDYGTISLVTIFITIANVFVTDGFGSALIQKKDADNIDFSTVFFFNIFFCSILYLIVFFLAIVVSNFYNIPILIPVLRVLGIKILISSVNSVQHAYVSRNMLFKRFFYSTLFGTIISAFVGVTMAYSGFGVWALVAQELTNSTIDMVVLWFTVKWRPKKVFSFDRLRNLFSYGWKLLLQSLFVTIYGNLRSLIIGKVYTTKDLAYYTKGSYYPNLIVANVDTALSSALFPAMSKEQKNTDQVKLIARKTTSMCSFVLSPLLIGFSASAELFVTVLLTEKWLPIVPFIRIICVGLLFRPAQSAMLQAVKAVGKSDLVLKYDLPIRFFGILAIIFTVKFGTIYIACTEVAVAILGLYLYSLACKKAVGYSVTEVLSDFIPNIVISILMGIVVYFVGNKIYINNIVTLFVQIGCGIITYIIISIVTKNKNYKYLIQILFKKKF